MKTQNIESRCYRTGKYTVCRRVRAFFSSEIVQAVVMKGFTYLLTKYVIRCFTSSQPLRLSQGEQQKRK